MPEQIVGALNSPPQSVILHGVNTQEDPAVGQFLVADPEGKLQAGIPDGVDVNNFPEVQTVDGTVDVGNFPPVQDVNLVQQDLGEVQARVVNAGDDPVSVTVENFPTSQDVVVTNTIPVEVQNNVVIDDTAPVSVILTHPTTVLTTKGSRLVGDTEVALAPANPNRAGLAIYNIGPDTVYLGETGVTADPTGDTTDGGWPLSPGQLFTLTHDLDHTAIYAICATEESATVAIRETSRT